jgi:hypothetical protein
MMTRREVMTAAIVFLGASVLPRPAFAPDKPREPQKNDGRPTGQGAAPLVEVLARLIARARAEA